MGLRRDPPGFAFAAVDPFASPGTGLRATTRNRVSVPVLKLQAPGDPDPIMLEGNRNPMTGAKSV